MGLLRALFRTPLYRRFVFLASTEVIGRLWDCDVWTGLVFHHLDDLLRSLSESSPSVHCRQTIGNQSRAVKMGALNWSKEGSEKWCHGSRVTAAKCSDWRFTDLQVYLPTKPELESSMEFPLVHIHMVPIGYNFENAAKYDQAVQISVLEDLYNNERISIDRIVDELRRSLQASAVFSASTKVKSLNSFESVLREDFMYTGMLEGEYPDERRMKNRWQRL